MNLQSDLCNSHFEILTLYHLWPNTSAINKFQKKILLLNSYSVVYNLQKKLQGLLLFNKMSYSGRPTLSAGFGTHVQKVLAIQEIFLQPLLTSAWFSG